MGTRVFTSAAKLALGILLAQAATVDAAEIRVITLPAYKSLIEKLDPIFSASTGHKLSVKSGLFSQLKAQIDAGDFDVVISSGPVTDYLSKQDKTVAGTRIEFSRIGIGVAVPTGAPKPHISSTDGFRRALLNARSINIPSKESTAGGYLVGLFDRLGVSENIKSTLKVSSGGGQTPKAVAAGEAELGISLLSEFVQFPGVEIVGPLPAELQLYVIQTAAIGATAKEPKVAEMLITYLRTPAGVALVKAEGLEPLAK